MVLAPLSDDCDSRDDNGTVKVWDLRQRRCCHELKEHEDFISDMTLADDGRTLLCAGGDGFLSVWNRKSGEIRPSYSSFSRCVLNVYHFLLSNLDCLFLKNRADTFCRVAVGHVRPDGRRVPLHRHCQRRKQGPFTRSGLFRSAIDLSL